MFVKIGPEPSVRKRYRGWSQYIIELQPRHFWFTVDNRGKIIICHSKFRVFRGKSIEKLKKN